MWIKWGDKQKIEQQDEYHFDRHTGIVLVPVQNPHMYIQSHRMTRCPSKKELINYYRDHLFVMSDNDDTLRYVHCEILIKGLHDKYYCDTSLANYILTTENSKIFIFSPH